MRIKFLVLLLASCLPAFINGQSSCFGGTLVYEKVGGVALSGPPSSTLLQQQNSAITGECQASCHQTGNCMAFSIDYSNFSCVSYDRNSDGRRELLAPVRGINYFEKVCLTGAFDYQKICGSERLWAFERVVESYLDGHVNKSIPNVSSRAECHKLCLTESDFQCRSASYDTRGRNCRLSKEDRRSKPEDFVQRPGSGFDYLENQCAGTLPDCRYVTQENVMVLTLDKLEFARSIEDCERLCDDSLAFTCRSYTFDQRESRCYLSGDDTTSLGGIALPVQQGSISGERQCTVSQCEKNQGTSIFVKITGYVLRSGRETTFDILTASRGVTETCSKMCRDEGAVCPAFSVDYENNRCFKLDRNSQGRTSEFTLAHGRNYFEKACVRVTLNTACASKGWQFERVPGKGFRSRATKVIPRIQNIRDCMEACLTQESFICRSAVYDSATLDCQLRDGDRRSMASEFVEANANFEYLENQCPSPVDCNYDPVQDSYPRYLDATVNSIQSIQDCQFQCTNFRGFNCRSFAYYGTASECLLSGDDRATAGNIDALSSRPGTTYYDRKCGTNAGGGAGGSRPGIGSGGTGFGGNQPGGGFGGTGGGGFGGTGGGGFGGTGGGGFGGSGGSGTNPGGSFGGTGGGGGTRPGGFGGTGGSGFGGTGSGNQPGGGFGGGQQPGFGLQPLPGTGVRPGGGQPGFGLQPLPGAGQPGFGSNPGSGFQPSPGFPGGVNPGMRGQDRRCTSGIRTYEKVTGFELSRVKSYPLYSETRPGITMSCIQRCDSDDGCHAFNLDHNRYECLGLERGATAQPSDVRPYAGVDHFEAVCLTGRICNRLWTFERVPDYQIIADSKGRFDGVTKDDCMNACLNAQGFECRSANYVYSSRTCHLFSDDRSTNPRGFEGAPNVDFLENQCAIPPTECSYRNKVSDKILVYVTKAVTVFSEVDCERQCTIENTFNCQSFSFLGETGNRADQCLLSSVRGNSVGESAFSFMRGAIYGEKVCLRFQTGGGNRPGGGFGNNGGGFGNTGGGFGNTGGGFGNAGGGLGNTGGGFGNTGGGFGNAGSGFGNTGGGFGNTGGGFGNAGGGFGNAGGGFGNAGGGFGNTGGGFGNTGGGGFGADMDIENCNSVVTYDKIFGMTYNGARKEEIRPREPLGITTDCLEVCSRQEHRCKGVSLETTREGNQRCFALDRVAGNNIASLVPDPQVSYFEKVCIPERSCGKAWTFVRAPGFDLDANGRVLPSIRSRQLCQAACLSATDLPCRSAVYNHRQYTCKLLAETRRSERTNFQFVSSDVEYLENQCAPEPPNCEFTSYEGMFLPHFDRYFANVFNKEECKEYCDRESDFNCRSYNYQSFRRECSLSSEDTGTAGTRSLLVDRDYFYADKAMCKNVRVDCTSSNMIVTFTFSSPFGGRVYAQGNPQVCFEMGSRDIELMLRIPLDSTCGTRLQGDGKYVNNVVIQQHPIIMQDSDKTIRVECSFDAGDQTVSFAPEPSPGRTGGGIDIAPGIPLSGPNDVSDVVSNTAPTPGVIMNIYKETGDKADSVDLGETLVLRIEMLEQSAFGIFARNLEARTEFGELMTLIDNIGCPRYPEIFTALQVDSSSKSLFSRFKAFRFPSTGRVNFVATIKFCQERCDPVNCGGGIFSHGKRRRRSLNDTMIESPVTMEEEEEEEEEVTTNSPSTHEVEISFDANNFFTVLPSSPTDHLENMTIKVSTGGPSFTISSPNDALTSPDDALDEEHLEYPTKSSATKRPPLPHDVPLALSLVVGNEEPMLEHYNTNGRNTPWRKETHIQENYICSPTSTIVAATVTLLVLTCASVTAFVVFYRMKKRHWNKMIGLKGSNLQNLQNFFPPANDILFRTPYSGYPNGPTGATKPSMFNQPLGNLPDFDDRLPKYEK